MTKLLCTVKIQTHILKDCTFTPQIAQAIQIIVSVIPLKKFKTGHFSDKVSTFMAMPL